MEENDYAGLTQTYDDALLSPAEHWGSLVFTSDDLTEHQLSLGLTRVGRDKNAELSIPSKVLSRFHAEIELTPQVFTICDLKSRNKTKRGKATLVPNVRYELKDGDSITFGNIRCQFRSTRDVGAFDDGAGEMCLVESDSEAPAEDDDDVIPETCVFEDNLDDENGNVSLRKVKIPGTDISKASGDDSDSNDDDDSFLVATQAPVGVAKTTIVDNGYDSDDDGVNSVEDILKSTQMVGSVGTDASRKSGLADTKDCLDATQDYSSDPQRTQPTVSSTMPSKSLIQTDRPDNNNDGDEYALLQPTQDYQSRKSVDLNRSKLVPSKSPIQTGHADSDDEDDALLPLRFRVQIRKSVDLNGSKRVPNNLSPSVLDSSMDKANVSSDLFTQKYGEFDSLPDAFFFDDQARDDQSRNDQSRDEDAATQVLSPSETVTAVSRLDDSAATQCYFDDVSSSAMSLKNASGIQETQNYLDPSIGRLQTQRISVDAFRIAPAAGISRDIDLEGETQVIAPTKSNGLARDNEETRRLHSNDTPKSSAGSDLETLVLTPNKARHLHTSDLETQVLTPNEARHLPASDLETQVLTPNKAHHLPASDLETQVLTPNKARHLPREEDQTQVCTDQRMDSDPKATFDFGLNDETQVLDSPKLTKVHSTLKATFDFGLDVETQVLASPKLNVGTNGETKMHSTPSKVSFAFPSLPRRSVHKKRPKVNSPEPFSARTPEKKARLDLDDSLCDTQVFMTNSPQNLKKRGSEDGAEDSFATQAFASPLVAGKQRAKWARDDSDDECDVATQPYLDNSSFSKDKSSESDETQIVGSRSSALAARNHVVEDDDEWLAPTQMYFGREPSAQSSSDSGQTQIVGTVGASNACDEDDNLLAPTQLYADKPPSTMSDSKRARKSDKTKIIGFDGRDSLAATQMYFHDKKTTVGNQDETQMVGFGGSASPCNDDDEMLAPTQIYTDHSRRFDLGRRKTIKTEVVASGASSSKNEDYSLLDPTQMCFERQTSVKTETGCNLSNGPGSKAILDDEDDDGFVGATQLYLDKPINYKPTAGALQEQQQQQQLPDSDETQEVDSRKVSPVTNDRENLENATQMYPGLLPNDRTEITKATKRNHNGKDAIKATKPFTLEKQNEVAMEEGSDEETQMLPPNSKSTPPKCLADVEEGATQLYGAAVEKATQLYPHSSFRTVKVENASASTNELETQIQASDASSSRGNFESGGHDSDDDDNEFLVATQAYSSGPSDQWSTAGSLNKNQSGLAESHARKTVSEDENEEAATQPYFQAPQPRTEGVQSKARDIVSKENKQPRTTSPPLKEAVTIKKEPAPTDVEGPATEQKSLRSSSIRSSPSKDFVRDTEVFTEPEPRRGKKRTCSKTTSKTTTTTSKNEPEKPRVSPEQSNEETETETDNKSRKSSRRSIFSANVFKVIFTGAVDNEAQEIVVDLKGSIVDGNLSPRSGVTEATVAVTDKAAIRRTLKYLCSVAMGKPVIDFQWIFDCKVANRFIDFKKYFVSEDVLKVYEKGGRMLSGLKIHVTPSVVPSPEQMAQIIECGGGVVLGEMPQPNEADCIIISCKEDCHLIPKSTTCPCLDREFILTGIVTGNLAYTKYRLNVPSKSRRKN